MSELIRAFVVDDEPDAREVVTTLLATHPEIDVIGESSNGRSAVDALRRLKPDLLFLDVQMPDLDGFGVLDALGADVPPGIVFVTAHDEHAIRAFEVHALDYVLKPFGRPRFDAAVARALQRLNALDALTMQHTLMSMSADRSRAGVPPSDLSASANRRLAIRNGARTILVPVESVDWIEALDDYARIHTGLQSHVVALRMHELERIMMAAGSFIRIHRSLIVNVARVTELVRDADGGGTVILETGVRLRVARGRWDALTTALLRSDTDPPG